MKLFLSFFILIALMACNSNTIPKKPKNLLSKEKMITVLTDVYISKRAKNVKNTNGERGINYHATIFKNHQIDSITFQESLKYYTADIKLHEEILKQVHQQIKQQLKSVKKLRINKEENKTIDKDTKVDKK